MLMSSYFFLGKEICIDIVPSSPKYIRNVEVSLCQKSIDEEHRSEERSTLYYGVKSLVKFDVADEYGNLIQQIRDERCYAVTIEYPETNVSYPLKWKMRSGKIFATFLPKLVGERQMIVRLVDKRLNSIQESTCTYRMPISVFHPSCSPSLTLKFLDENLRSCTAGKDFIFEVQIYDVFGNHVLQDCKESCDIVVQVPPFKTAVKQLGKEQVNVTKVNSPKHLSFAATVCFEIAGLRKVRLFVNSGSNSSSKDIYVKVLSSTPHQLHDVRFTTNGAMDKSFSADPKVMYRNQWSNLEARLVDCYENVVQELTNDYNIGFKLSNERQVEMVYKDAVVRNETLEVQIKINEAGNYDLLITLTDRKFPDQVFHLKAIKIQVENSPLYLAGSQFCYPESGVAGKKIQLEILPVDVFGCPVLTSSTINYNLTGDILNSPLEMDKNRELMDFSIIEDGPNIKICVSIVLNKAGARKLMIFDSDNKSKKIRIHIRSDLDDVRLEQTAPKATAYRTEKLVLTMLLFDRFNNQVRVDALESIPDLLEKDGPGGLHCTGKSMENNQVTIQCHFKRTGKYNLCLVDGDGNSLGSTSFSITVKEAPVDYGRSSITWSPQYDDIEDQPVFPEDESFQCCLKLKDIFDNYSDAHLAKDSIHIEYDNTEVKNIKVSSCANEIGCYNIVVPLNGLLNDRPNPKLWCFVNGIKIENPLVLPTLTVFEKYDDERDCKLQGLNIVCNSVKSEDVISNRDSYVENMKRVCKLESIEVDDVEDSAVIKLQSDEIEYTIQGGRKIRCPPKEIKNKLQQCRNILLHFLRAKYYRDTAFLLDEAREEWKTRASENYRENKGGGRPHFCSKIKEKYAALMKRYHTAACEEFFQFFNAERHQSEIDLHGLLVVDERKLLVYKRQLLSRGRLSSEEVNKKIEDERDHGNEAIRYCFLS